MKNKTRKKYKKEINFRFKGLLRINYKIHNKQITEKI